MPSTTPAVTVLLPVFNALGTLPRAVESVRRQTFTDWELVAVDDGSSDGSGEWLQRAAREEPHLRVVRRPHEGLVAALNTGLSIAASPWIARLDADDECTPTRLEEQLRFAALNPDLGVVGSLVEYAGDREANAGYAHHVDWLNTVVTAEEIGIARFIESPFAHPSVMFRRELADRHGGYRDGPFPEDYELWLRWLEAGVPMAKVPRPLLRWHDPPGRLSRIDDRYSPEAFYRLKAAYLARWLRQALMSSGERQVLVWGAGRVTRRRVSILQAEGVRISAFIDIDSRKQGTQRDGRIVLAPEEIPGPDRALVLGYVAKRGAREAQREFLIGRGFQEGRDFLFAA